MSKRLLGLRQRVLSVLTLPFPGLIMRLDLVYTVAESQRILPGADCTSVCLTVRRIKIRHSRQDLRTVLIYTL